MNEQQWLTCRGPRPMLAHLRVLDGKDRGKLSERRLRQMRKLGEMRPIEHKLGLFACYCQRKKHEYYGRRSSRLGSLGHDESVRLGRDGLAAMDEIEAVERGRTLITRGDRTTVVFTDLLQPEQACTMVAQHRVLSPRQLVTVLRDIFGNPFRPVAFSPGWRTDTAVALARTMYEARAFGAMPILADALQDAGCDNDDVLNHCRDASQTHVCGCWVVDSVLSQE